MSDLVTARAAMELIDQLSQYPDPLDRIGLIHMMAAQWLREAQETRVMDLQSLSRADSRIAAHTMFGRIRPPRLPRVVRARTTLTALVACALLLA